MRRTQIQLTEEQAEVLQKLARLKKLSIAEIIRRGINLYLQMLGTVTPDEWGKRAIAATGRFHSGVSDLSTKHDKYLLEDYKK